jgi:UDP-N-acetylmuramate: L-alanyl-gamma-D-glutamyl-meso-diaminopimelate ligase
MLIGDSKRGLRAHFAGIGGTAMVAGARLALEAGWEIRGSDNVLYPPTSEMVRALGVHVYEGYAASNLDWNPDIVIVGNALSRGNTEVEAALERRMHYVSLPEWLKDVVLRRRRPAVIAGTHGKTTTTALTAYVLDRCGLAPGYLIGGQPLDFEHSARLGNEGAPFVIEGDEYDTAFFDKRAKFFHYLPEIAVVTSVEFDHGDIYGDIAQIEQAFRWMLRQIPEHGRLIVCADDPGAAALAPHAFCPVETYGFNDGSDWRGHVDQTPDGLALSVERHGRMWGRFISALAGMHNLRNTLAAIAVAATYGATPDHIASALPGFKSVRRRMEVFHEARGITFVDDFAHHPTAIRETLLAARQKWPDRRLWALFEPRSNTTVTNRFQNDLVEAFKNADRVWLGPIHRAESIPEARRLHRAALCDDLKQRGVRADFSDDVDALVADVAVNGRAGDIVMILSNGSFGGIYGKISRS